MSPEEQRRALGAQTEKELEALGVDSGPLAEEPAQAVDLRKIPLEGWDEYVGAPVLLPPDVAAYVAGMTDLDTMLERDSIEELTIRFHGLSEPYTVVYRDGC